MRPLPDLLDLPPQPTLFDPSADGFLAFFAGDFSQQDALLSSMDDQQNSLAGGLDPIDAAIDNLDQILDQLAKAFDDIAAAVEQVDLTAAISDALGLDGLLDSSLGSWSPDFSAVASFFLDFLDLFVSPLIDGAVQSLSELISEQLILSTNSCDACSGLSEIG